jgi:hypothetical protein
MFNLIKLQRIYGVPKLEDNKAILMLEKKFENLEKNVILMKG